jgi:hypothetical protein
MKFKILLLTSLTAAVASTAAADDIQQDLARGISGGLNQFVDTYKVSGMAGVQDAVEACYKKQTVTASVEGVAACASMDKRAKDEDQAFSSQYGTPRVRYFTGTQPAKRLKAAVKGLKLAPGETKVLLTAISEI